MKRTININLFLTGIILVLYIVTIPAGCERTELRSDNSQKTGGLFEKNGYNLDMQDFSLAVTSAIKENKSFRNLVKEEALKMFDGDYDVLLSNIVNYRVDPAQSSVKSAGENFCVRDLLQSHFKSSLGPAEKKSSGSVIDDLISKYPYLQISVPVNAEKWVNETYVPVVTFIPLEFDEATTEEVVGYTSDGSTVVLDAVNPPEDPVIVISMNERIEIIEEPKGPVLPPAPYNLTGVLTESGIRLNWVMPDTANVNNTTGYYVYRKSSSDSYFALMSTVIGVNNRSYDDNNVVSQKSYSYYVLAYYESEISSPTNYLTISAPPLPKPVLSFDAIQHAKSIVELRWQNDNTQYIMETRVYKNVVGVNPDYVLYKTFTSGQYDYFDTDIAIGKKTIYKVVHVTPLGESNPKYDFIQAPYRDISQDSPVYIKQIKFTDWKIESWIAGKPEFYITVTNVEPVNKNPFKVQDQINCMFSKRSKVSQVFTGVKVLDWQPGFWYDMLTFTAEEYDRPSGKLTVKIGVGFNAKDTLKLGFLQGTAGVDYEIEFQNKGEKCGSSYFDYFDNPESWLIFPNYGVQILVSESDI
ncbi:MAG: hypothetical protein MUO72_07330 [Bacteroidales bacterium]|nr:hypothetical protein [Bacteroidales bacterium]